MRNHVRFGVPRAAGLAVLAMVALALAPAAQAQTVPGDNNACDLPGEAPDIIVGDLNEIQKYGTFGNISAWAMGTVSCNVGTCQANWISGTPDHPVISQNMFRLKDGRFEQIGQAWLKHGFATLNGGLCGNCMQTGGSHLGVNCSDPYGAGLNASQGNLGPKFEVNAATGDHEHPFTGQGQTGNSIYKRLQVHHDDLDPTLNPGAQYWIESQYVNKDDAAANNHICSSGETPGCNNSVRKVNVSGAGGNYNLSFSGSTLRERAAIALWAEEETGVLIKPVFIDGIVLVGSKATDMGGGIWEYEYALHNVTSHRSIESVSVPIPAGAAITNVGFHDVEYHSGSPYSNKDWDITVTGSNVEWATDPFDVDQFSNALRWGTLYNYRFRANVPPVDGSIELGVYRPGSPTTIQPRAFIPDPTGTGLGTAGQIPNGGDVPGVPLLLEKETNGDVTLSWDDSCVLNNTEFSVYEGLVGDYSDHNPVTCDVPGTSTTFTPSSSSSYYLVVPTSGAGEEGSYGTDSEGDMRVPGNPACHPQNIASCE